MMSTIFDIFKIYSITFYKTERKKCGHGLMLKKVNNICLESKHPVTPDHVIA